MEIFWTNTLCKMLIYLQQSYSTNGTIMIPAMSFLVLVAVYPVATFMRAPTSLTGIYRCSNITSVFLP